MAEQFTFFVTEREERYQVGCHIEDCNLTITCSCPANAECRITTSEHGERHAGAGFMRVGSALSEVVEEGEQGIAGLEPPEALTCRRHVLKRLFFGFQVRLNVDLCCLRTLVVQP